jgi:hypothetical protein
MSEEKGATDQARFFNVSLINATPMPLPKFSQPQRLMGELIHSIEAASAKFAWVQSLFRRVNLSPTFVALKNSMHVAAERIKARKRSRIDDSGSDRPELYRDWYRRSGERIKRIGAVLLQRGDSKATSDNYRAKTSLPSGPLSASRPQFSHRSFDQPSARTFLCEWTP